MTSPSLTDEELRAIVARASTLDERLSGAYEPLETAPGAAAQARLQRWCETIARGDQALFRSRLSWDGWDEEPVLRALDGVRLREGKALPEWSELLAEASRCAGGLAAEGPRGFLDGADPLPFEEILAPFVVAARRRLHADESRRSLLSDGAENQLARSLLRHLIATAVPTLFTRFSSVRMQLLSPLDRILAAATGSRAFYREFANELLAAGLAPLIQAYPVLARMLAQAALFWSEATGELLDRLARDHHDLAAFFGGGADPGTVTEVESALSDPHRGQRQVVLLTFASGLKVVYKPKRLRTEAAFGRLLVWLNERGSAHKGAPLPPFRALDVLDRGDYGWVEYIERRPCLDQEQARRYYTRAGMLLSVLHMLEATDCHRDNLIAHGEHPVLIDVETLMHHRGRADMWQGIEERPAAEELLDGSVLRIGLLPMWSVHGDELVAYDVSALAGSDDQAIPFERAEWTAINTDAMELAYQPDVMPPGKNVATLDGQPLRLDAYQNELQVGFAGMERLVISCRDDLLRPGSPLYALASEPVRCIFRYSRVYGGLLHHRLREPACLADGADWSVELEQLTRAAMPQTEEGRAAGARPPSWPFFRAERMAMTRGDIPLFLALPTSDALEVDGDVIPAAFEEPSSERVTRRLQDMDEVAIAREAALIRAAVYARTAQQPSKIEATSMAELPEGADTEERQLQAEELLAEALEVAEEIRRHALIGSDGGATWVVPSFLVKAGRYQLAPSDHSLYSGAPGIALFLAAAAALSGQDGFRGLALAALHPLRQSLRREGALAGRNLGPGAGTGIGSICYAFTRIGGLLDEPDLLQAARAFALMLTDSRIAEDQQLDVIAGSAGGILGLLPLYRITGDDEVLERAVACGRHLLASRRQVGPGMAAWPTSWQRLLTGFSHGAAGIAYALLQLYQIRPEQAFLDAAMEAVAYEDSMFRSEEGNWLDLRAGDEPAFMTAWCHGAPGIGLSRAASLPALGSPRVHADIEVALATTIAAGSGGVETLCCGVFGRSEILLALAGKLDRPSLAEEALRITSQVVGRARRRGRYNVHPFMPPDLHAPGFFQGTAGAGYALLRLAYPDRLPSVLLFE